MQRTLLALVAAFPRAAPGIVRGKHLAMPNNEERTRKNKRARGGVENTGFFFFAWQAIDSVE